MAKTTGSPKSKSPKTKKSPSKEKKVSVPPAKIKKVKKSPLRSIKKRNYKTKSIKIEPTNTKTKSKSSLKQKKHDELKASAALLARFLKVSGPKPKPQSKASAKLKEAVQESAANNNNNNNNNNVDIVIPPLQVIEDGSSLYYSHELSDYDSDSDIEASVDNDMSTPEVLSSITADEAGFAQEEPEVGCANVLDENKPAPTKAKKTQFECKVCHEWFPNRYFQRKHMLREHEDQLYECRVCSFNSVEPEKLKTHIIKLHVAKKEKAEAISAMDMQEELEKLMEKKIPRKVIMEDGVSLGRDVNSRMRYVCALCHRIYTSKYSLERHVRCHTLEKPYSCDVCDFTSSYKEHMMRHITSVHLIVHSNDPKKKYIPKNRRPANEQEEEDEEEEENESPDGVKKRRNILRKRFECAVCGLKSTHKSDLMTHIKDRHPNAHIESLKNNDGSKVHLVVTVAKKPKATKKLTIQCTHCSLIFHDTWKYKVHLRSHTGVKPFRCSECSFRATSKMTVRDHIHRKHPKVVKSSKIFLRTIGIDGAVEEVPLPVPWREFKCEFCGKLQTDNYTLKLHKQKEHKDSLPFTCTGCKHKEQTKAGMIIHCTKSHEGINASTLILHYGKPVKITAVKLPTCDICNKVFAYQSQLNIHTKLHTGEKCFKCEHCEYKTNAKVVLSKHIINEHLGGKKKRNKSRKKIMKLTTRQKQNQKQKKIKVEK